MKRLGGATFLLVLAMAGTAYALTYVPGAYNVDSCAITTAKPCSNDPNGQLRMRITKGHFRVQRVFLTETCTNTERSFQERIGFRSGTNAVLAGGVGSAGRFHDRYDSSSGFFKITGRVQGRRLVATVTEAGSFTQGDEPTFNCSGQITFHAKRS